MLNNLRTILKYRRPTSRTSTIPYFTIRDFSKQNGAGHYQPEIEKLTSKTTSLLLEQAALLMECVRLVSELGAERIR